MNLGRWIGAAYAIAFALLYLLVFLLFPPNLALHILQTCRTSMQGLAVNFAVAPISYFEVLVYILKLQHLLGHAIPYGEVMQLLLLNFVAVELLIFGSFAYFYAKRRAHAYNAQKVFWSGVFASYMLVAIEALYGCGTGTSIIGVSLTSILLACVGSDLFHAARNGEKLTSQALRVLAFAFLATMLVGYLLSPIVHLSGLALFITILFIWDKSFRKDLLAILTLFAQKIGLFGTKR